MRSKRTVRRPALLVWVFLFALPLTTPACAQSQAEIDAIKKEIAALKAGQDALRKELAEIKDLLKPEEPEAIVSVPPGRTVPLAGAQMRGASGAKVVLLEFSDYECPFCARFARDTLPQITSTYVDTGKVRHAFRAFPLEAIHKNAFKAHEAALCGGDQGKFWPLHLLFFSNTRALGASDLAKHAEQVGLDMAAFTKCLDSGTKTAAVRADVNAGLEIGVQGTPLFLIGTAGPNGELQLKKAISGAHPFPVFQQAIEDVLAGK